jgi:hypothetical protein
VVSRRSFVKAGVALFATPLAAEAQPAPRMYRIGVVSPVSTNPNPTVDALRQGLQELGYVEGGNAILVTRFGDGRTERLPELVAETISQQVDARGWLDARGACRQKSNHERPCRVRGTLRSGHAGHRGEPRAPGREHHRRLHGGRRLRVR